MSLLALTSAKGAPGVSTAAAALAAVWPRRSPTMSVVLAECDPFGGDLALRLRGAGQRPLAHDRGMVSLASAVRHDAIIDTLADHVQLLDGGLPVLVGPRGPRNAQAMAATWPLLGRALAGIPDTDILADCGRIVAGSEASHVIGWADLVAVVTSPTVEGVAHTLQALDVITSLASSIGLSAHLHVIVVAEPRRERGAVAEVHTALDRAGAPARVVGTLAYDPLGAAGLRGEWGKRLDRSLLVGSARRLASRLARLMPPPDLVRVAPPAVPAARPATLPPSPLPSAPPADWTGSPDWPAAPTSPASMWPPIRYEVR